MFSPQGMLVAMLNGSTVRITWQLLGMFRDTQGLSSISGLLCKCNTQCRKRSSPQVLILICRLLIHEVPSGCVRWRLGHVVFVNQQNKLNQEITGTQRYLSLFPAYSSILFSSRIIETTNMLNTFDITWLAQNKVSCSKTHPISYMTLYVPSGLSFTTCSWIVM